MKIVMRIGTVDMDGYNGREHHPTKEMEGRFVRITNMEMMVYTELLESTEPCTECGAPAGGVHTADCAACDCFMVLYGILLDANGEDVEGGEVELIDHEIVQHEDMPVLFGELLA